MKRKQQFALEWMSTMVALFVLSLGTGSLRAADPLKADGPGGRSDALVDRWRAIVASYPIPQPPTSGVIEIIPTETPSQINAKIAKASEGAVFLIKASAPNTPTVYRRWSVMPKKNQKFYGQLGTDGKTRLITLKGSVDKTPGVEGISWTRDEGAERWWCTETGPLGRNPQFERYPKGYQRNAYGRVVVIDGHRPLNHYDDQAAVAGKEDGFFLDDANDRLYLGFKPDGKSVELMTDVDCFKAAEGVEIYNFKVQHYANPIQAFPVRIGEKGRAEYLEISHNHAGAIQFATGAIIRNCLLTHNLQQGYGGGGSKPHDALLEGNEISFNNVDLGKGKFTEWWESGGGKIAFAENTSLRNNYVHDNAGPGIWYDIANGRDAFPVMAEGNICERNTTGGMWQELGYVAIFRGNYSRNNPKSAQILIAEAGASEKFVPTIPGGSVYGNIAEIHSADQSGIAFRVMTKAQRGNGPGGEYFVRNYSIHHNHIVHRIAGGKSGALGVGKQPIPDAFVRQQFPYGNNHFDANIYHVPVGTAKTGTYWTWGSMKTFEQFQADGHEAHGSVIEDGATWQDMTPPPVPPVPAVSGTATDPVLTGTTEPAAMILVYEGTKLIATACADDTGKWSAKLTGLSVGSHTLKVAAADPAKNVSGYSTVTAVTVSNGANLILFATQARSAETLRPDLKAIGLGKGWKGATALTKLVEKDGAPAIEFNKSGANVVWLDGFEFADGVIEFDAKGKSMPPQSSFVGIAFRVRDAMTYDAVCFRPFNFRADEAEKKSHAVQYVSEPEWPWQRLRKEKTGQYEKPITPAPDGDQWFHARIVIAKPTVTVYVNGANQASLEVKELADRKSGSVGLWCNGYGLIANLKIAPAK